MSKTGTFVISLDFELYWGMFDKVTLAQYGENVAGVHTALPKLLTLFTEYEIHATWATVGMLMADCEQTLKAHLPSTDLHPQYDDMRVSAYEYLRTHSPLENKYHFGPHLVELILKTPQQELGSHTFSHYYAQDGVKNGKAVFQTDCEAFKKISARFGVPITSIVFPRNQVTSDALEVCRDKGFTAYRGTPRHFLYTGKAEAKQTNPVLRALRLLDTYLNLSGYHTYSIDRIRGTNSSVNRTISSTPKPLVNVQGSWFLRPYNHRLRLLERLKIRRIKNAMTYAAKNGEVYHLWWHPHNFGINQDQNFKNLKEILEHYKYLQKKYGIESKNMREVTTPENE
jgi:peptidoglycan/xylan/chitin deacetylase (PgdA/CDA1 family)